MFLGLEKVASNTISDLQEQRQVFRLFFVSHFMSKSQFFQALGSSAQLLSVVEHAEGAFISLLDSELDKVFSVYFLFNKPQMRSTGASIHSRQRFGS